ncbi:MAG: TonB-dependent receptor [Deltaproteobacteria bacterium]|nr:TonB-dependent receptor [Deltaproteobacteria bacterium]
MKCFSRTTIVCAAVTQLMALPGIGLAGQDMATGREPAKKALKLEDIVVTATRTPEEKKELPQVVDVISTKDISMSVGDDLTDVIKENSSVDVIQYPGGYSGTISIRGVRSDYWGTIKHCLILVDGRPIGATTLASVNKNTIRRIEVLKGPASSLYGSDAMGGVVNIITKETKGKIKTSLAAGGGSFATWNTELSSGGNITDRIDFNIDASAYQQNGDIRMGNGHKRDHTAFKKYNGTARLGLDLADSWRLDMKGNWYAGRDIENPNDIDWGDSKQKKRDVDQYGGDLSLSGKIAKNNEVNLTFYDSREENKYRYEYAGINPYKGSWNRFDWLGTQLQDTHRWGAHSLTFGVDYQKVTEEGKSWNADGTRKGPWRPDNERETLSAFGEAMLKFFDNRMVVTMGGRYNAIELKTKETPYKTGFTPGSETFNAFNPSGGLKLFLSPQWQIHSTIGTAFVTPKPEQVAGTWVSSWGTTTKGNPGLDPENSVSWDAGISHSKKEWGLSGDLTYFMTDIDDKIEKVKVGNSLYTYENALKARIRGLEGEFSFDIGTLAKLDYSVRLFANFTRLFKAEETLSTGRQDIRNIADTKINYGLEYDDGHFFNGRLTARYVGHRKDTDWAVKGSPEVENPAFTVVDVAVNFHLAKRQDLSFQIANVFDEYYYETKGYPLPGRSFFGKYTIGF